MKPHAGQPVEQAGALLGESRAVMIMVHGRNAAPHNILELSRALERPAFTYLAPAAANHTWYPLSFMAGIERNQPDLTSALTMLASLVEDVMARGIRAEHIVLLGFSQGACLAGEFAVRHARRWGGVVMYSGGLIGPPGTTWDYQGDFQNTPVFLGCSDVDSHVPKARVDESATVFERMGAAVTKRIYPGMGHIVNAEEIALTQQIMDTILAAHAD
ncbi:MAG: dienelactone hydrolase family protein [Gemmatimonadetes bacterium]|nr:dienelactone hydrolase family protein [Gemmatimonadota bacterium]